MIKSIFTTLALALVSCAQQPEPTDPTPPIKQKPIKKPAFKGVIKFHDANCPKQNPPQFCKLASVHRFSNAKSNRSWQTDKWGGKTHNADGTPIQSGTTNGADIPRPVWGLVGHPFDPKILPAAIIHDHYTFKENRVINWYDTHLMYLQILLDQGLSPIKAYTQYFAIYTFGAHWTPTVRGEKCTDVDFPCLKDNSRIRGKYHQESRLHTAQAIDAITQVYHQLSATHTLAQKPTPLTPETIHALALQYDPANPFLHAKNRSISLTPKNRSWLSKHTTFTPRDTAQ